MKKLIVKIKVIDIPYSPATEAYPEQMEVSHEEILAQTEGSEEELSQWLEGDKFKYPEGYWVEYENIDQDIENKKAIEQAKEEINKGMNGIAAFKVQFKKKTLTQEQIAQFFSSPEISKIIALLSTGSLPLAEALINAYQADGVIVTEEDKLEVIKAIK